MRKTDPHQKDSSSQPPISGPRAATPPPRPDHRAIAVTRARPRYRAEISDSVVGKSSAAAKPPAKRASVRISGEGAHAASIAVGTVSTQPSTNSSLRP